MKSDEMILPLLFPVNLYKVTALHSSTLSDMYKTFNLSQKTLLLFLQDFYYELLVLNTNFLSSAIKYADTLRTPV